MKQFSVVKVGYSTGIYGCSGEYFLLVYTDGEKMQSIHFSGMYGAESRISNAMKEKEYTEFYIPNRFGKMTRDDKKGFISEHEALEEIKVQL